MSKRPATLTYEITRECPTCGKMFFIPVPDMRAYRRDVKGGGFFCSWHCVRTWDKEHEAAKKEVKRARIYPAFDTRPRVEVSKVGFKYAREKAGLTQEEVGKRLGYSPAYMRDRENGKVATSAREDLERLADILECDVRLLMRGGGGDESG